MVCQSRAGRGEAGIALSEGAEGNAEHSDLPQVGNPGLQAWPGILREFGALSLELLSELEVNLHHCPSHSGLSSASSEIFCLFVSPHHKTSKGRAGTSSVKLH